MDDGPNAYAYVASNPVACFGSGGLSRRGSLGVDYKFSTEGNQCTGAQSYSKNTSL
ncbi:hypothetical protein ACJJIR_13950 [Microbulbifer sp. SSSA008]|uniref:hypothetical protein n=1 Tax=Microbulbifer sp. SSSA008 TaxID=3243380 RepID=UPI004039EB00